MNLRSTFLAFTIFIAGGSVVAQKYTSVEAVNVVKEYDGVSFSSEKTLQENLTDIDNFEIFSGILADQGETLFSEGAMLTVFVLEDGSFPTESEEEETQIIPQNTLRYLIVPGRLDLHGIKKAVEKGGGSASLATLSGENLIVRMNEGIVSLFDSNGNSAAIVGSDFYHKHGFFHIVNGLILPMIEE